MILLFIIATFSRTVSSDDVQCVVYSFTEDLYRKFCSKGCDKPASWSIVDYESIGVVLPDESSSTGLRTTGQSCTSSFPITLSAGGTVHVPVLADNCGVTMKMYKETTNDVIAEYSRFIKNIVLSGWSTISLEFEKGVGEVYITFSGYCEHNGYLIIDSFQYLPPGIPKSQCHFNHEQELLDGEFILMNHIASEKYSEDIVNNEVDDGSREDEGSGMESEEEETINDEEGASFWNPWTISVVTVAGVAGLGALSYGAYQFGKVRAADVSYRDMEELDRTRTITVPRVRSIYGGSPGGNVSGRFY